MSSLFPRMYEFPEAADEDRSFGGVTATDFFGLLMVSMFALTLLAALTLGASGNLDTPRTGASGGVSAATEGQQFKQMFQRLHLELIAVKEGDLNLEGELKVTDLKTDPGGESNMPENLQKIQTPWVGRGTEFETKSLLD